MKTIGSWLQDAATAISSYTALSTWLAAQYPDTPTLNVYIGLDDVNPPSENECPFVVVMASDRPFDVGTATEQRKPTFEVEFGLLDKRTTVASTTTTETGEINITQFGEYIRAALTAKFSGSTSDGDHFQVANMNFLGTKPLWQGGMSVTLTYETGMDSEP